MKLIFVTTVLVFSSLVTAENSVHSAPKYCEKYYSGLQLLDAASPNFSNDIYNYSLGVRECINEVANVPLGELQVELKAMTDLETAVCGKPYDRLLIRELTFQCEVAHAYRILLLADLRERIERPYCHAYFRVQYIRSSFTREQLAQMVNDCAREASNPYPPF